MPIIIKEDTLKMHKQAMYFAQDAVVARHQGKEIEALYNFKKALGLEEEVLSKIKASETNIETLGMILRSTASLAMNCYQYEKVAEIIFANKDIKVSKQIRTELDELLSDIEILNEEWETLSVSDETMIIERSITHQFIERITLERYCSGVVFDDMVRVSEYIKKGRLPAVIIFGGTIAGTADSALNELVRLIYKYQLKKRTHVIWLKEQDYKYEDFATTIANVVDETLIKPYNPTDLREAVLRITDPARQKYKTKKFEWKSYLSNKPLMTKSIGGWKRLFDIIFSLLAIIICIPVFLIIAIAIKIESKGPVFYKSYRAGRFFKVFNFYKFRTMVMEADKKIERMAHLNQYEHRQNIDQARFVKIMDDPRITRIGRFLRNTSLDELPQLLNILKGDMSLVGNRPLPLYEASILTSDRFVERFMAPAGITGLWQIKRRNNANMSAEERIDLDIQYSRKHNFLMDAWIIIKTPLALFKKSSV